MKTRDELAEMFAVATAQEYASTDGQPDDLARWAFACADAFVAERERRALANPLEAPASEDLRFTASGALLSADGHRYAERERDGYSADAAKLGSGFISVVRIAARDRAHAERIVAAMLPVGRGTP